MEIEKIRRSIDDIALAAQAIPAEITFAKLEEQGDIVIELKIMAGILKGGLQCINGILAKAEAHLCRTIANELEDVTYRHPRATLTASATGFFQIDDPREFLKTINGDLDLFLELVKSKTSSKEYFEKFLSSGLPLPTGVKSYVIPKVNVRMKK